MTRLMHFVGNYMSAYRLSPFVRSKSMYPSRFDPTQTPAWFQTVIASRRSSAALREHLAHQPGEQRLEFLLVYMGFTQVSNGLQRFEHLRAIIHRFVREGSERCLPLSEDTRRRVLREWAPWNKESRIPEDSAFPCLNEVADNIHTELATQGRYGKGIREWLSRYTQQIRYVEERDIECLDTTASVTMPLR